MFRIVYSPFLRSRTFLRNFEKWSAGVGWFFFFISSDDFLFVSGSTEKSFDDVEIGNFG